MIEAFHSYGLKTVFTAPELAFDSWICLCGAGRMRPAIDNAARAIFGGRDPPRPESPASQSSSEGLVTRHPAKNGQMHDSDRAAFGTPA